MRKVNASIPHSGVLTSSHEGRQIITDNAVTYTLWSCSHLVNSGLCAIVTHGNSVMASIACHRTGEHLRAIKQFYVV